MRPVRGQHQENVGLDAPAVGHDPGDRLLLEARCSGPGGRVPVGFTTRSSRRAGGRGRAPASGSRHRVWVSSRKRGGGGWEGGAVGEAAVAVVGVGADVRGWEGAVHEQAVAGLHLA